MKTVLVTGGFGFIGSNFIRYMLDKYKDYRIINLDMLTYAANPANLADVCKSDLYKFVKGDICDKDLVTSVFEKSDIDYVINFAAETHVDRSISDPEIFIKTNILGSGTLLSAAMSAWKVNDSFKQGKKFLQISTDEVYGALGETGFFTETTPLNPHSPYSASKASADMLVLAYFYTYKMPVNITRCSNNFGPYQYPEKLIPIMIKNAISKKSLPVYGDGLNVRDWLFVEDHCRAIDIVLHNGRIGEIYNIGGHNEKSNIHIVKEILSYLNKNYDKDIDEKLIEYVKDRKGHDRRYAIDAAKIERELGWVPKANFEAQLNMTIKWYIDNIRWMEK